MLTKTEIHHLISICQLAGKIGLDNGTKAEIPKLTIDIVCPPNDFIGTISNLAIFVNNYTYKHLGKFHPNWIMNQTIAVQEALLNQPKLEIIGAIVHEVGHAFNVAAKLANTEANAYIFEIQLLSSLTMSKLDFFNEVSDSDLKKYFESRLPYYKIGISTNTYLAELVEQINKQFDLGLKLSRLSTLKSENNFSKNYRFFEKSYKEEPILFSNLTPT